MIDCDQTTLYYTRLHCKTMNLTSSADVMTTLNCGGPITAEYLTTLDQMSYWFEGVFTCGLGGLGFLGNILTISVLLTK